MMKNQRVKASFMIFFITLVSVFFLSTLSYAEKSRSLWQRRQKNIETIESSQRPVKKTFQRQIDPLKVKIPDEFGTIIESHRGSNGKLIVHIQDAHANFEGQMNLAHILESLIKDYELNLVLLEGGISNRDFTHLRDRAPLEERKEKAEKLLKEGTLTGEFYLNIASDYPMSFQGIEDRNIYDANLDAMWEVDTFKEAAGSYVDELTGVANIIKERIYNQDLLDIDKGKEDYDTKKIDLIAYYRILYDKASTKNISLSKFPNFINIIKANDLEKTINIDKIKERKATPEEIQEYKDYVEISRKLDINELFKEEPLLEEYLRESLATTSDQKGLIKISKALSIMKNFFRLKIIPAEYDYFLEHKENFDATDWSKFLKEKSSEYNLSLNTPKNHSVITDNLGKVKRFYEVAEERNHVFLRKTEARIQKDNVNLAALIAGGFHTPNLTKLLAQAGYSYLVVSPKITEETDEELYRSKLGGDWLPE